MNRSDIMLFKKFTFLLIFLTFATLFSADLKKDKSKCTNFSFLNDIELEIENDKIIMTSIEEPYDTIVFTDDNELYINGEKIDLNRRQKKLVKKYRHEIYDIIDMAGEVGLAGAEVGIEGARIGMKAIVKCVKLLDEDYDAEDLEEELEEESEKLEEYAEVLKEKAEELEEMEEDLQETHEDLRESLKELRYLGWF